MLLQIPNDREVRSKSVSANLHPLVCGTIKLHAMSDLNVRFQNMTHFVMKHRASGYSDVECACPLHDAPTRFTMRPPVSLCARPFHGDTLMWQR